MDITIVRNQEEDEKPVSPDVYFSWAIVPKEVPPPKMIAAFGKIGTGKNYLLEKVLLPALKKQGISIVILAFADQLKMDGMQMQGFTFMQVFAGTKEQHVRNWLQDHGESKRQIDPDVWIKETHPLVLLHAFRGTDLVLIADMRYPNEAEYIKYLRGLRICIDAPKRNHIKLVEESKGDPVKYELTKNHISETALDAYTDFDHRILNDPEHESTSSSILCNAVSSYIGCTL